MTKRFKLFTGNNYGVQSVDGEVFIDSIVSIGDADVLVDLLNELSDENEQLRSSSWYMLNWIQNKHPKEYKYFKRIVRGESRIVDENARLMQEVSEYSRKAKELVKENEQLKQAYNDAKSDVERYEQILKDIMNDNLLIQDLKEEMKGDVE